MTQALFGLRRIFLISGLLLMFGGQWMIYRDPPLPTATNGYLLMLIGLTLFAISLISLSLNADVPIRGAFSDVFPHLRRRWFIGTIVLACFVAWLSTVKPVPVSYVIYVLLWLLVMFGLVRSVTPRQGEAFSPDDRSLQRRDWTLLIVLFVVGLLIRTIDLNAIPAVFDQDEALFAGDGAHIRFNRQFMVTPFEPGVQSHPRLFQTLIGFTSGIFGQNALGARLPAALLGALGIPAIYLLGRELLGWQTGLIAAVFALSWPLHVQFSRLSMNQPADPLFATLAFYFLLRGLRLGRAVDYVLSGIMLGVTQFFYLGGRLAPFVMLAYLLFLMLRCRQSVLKQWRLLILIPVAALIVTLPQNIYLLTFRLPLTTRADKNIFVIGQFNLAVQVGDTTNYMLSQFRTAFTGLFSSQDRGGWYGTSSNLMGPAAGALLLLGVLFSLLVLWKKPTLSLPLGWSLAVIIVGSVFSISPPQYQRYFPSVSALAILVAMGINLAALSISHLIVPSKWANRLALGIGCALFTANLLFFVTVYVPEKTYLANRPNWVVNQLAKDVVAAADRGYQINLLTKTGSGVTNSAVIQYMMMGRVYKNLKDPLTDDVRLEVPEAGKPFIYFVPIDRQPELAVIIRQLPGGNLSSVYLPEDGSLGYLKYESPDAP